MCQAPPKILVIGMKATHSCPPSTQGGEEFKGLAFSGRQTTCVLNRSTRVTLRSREEQILVLHGDAGKSGVGGGI